MYRGPILCRAVRERWQSGLDHRQRRQTRHGRGVQAIIQNRSRRMSEDDMLDRLRTLYQARGHLAESLSGELK